MVEDFSAEAEHFINNEKPFHLGVLPTEQSHPKTRNLSWTLESDVEAGLRMLLSVDRDIVDVATDVFQSEEYADLVRAFKHTIRSGGKICFSGCGATGRLSILLEASWRNFWHKMAELEIFNNQLCYEMLDRVSSIMTGGDFALIRSVEGFEDYISFGKQQVVETQLSEGDMLVAISEGGETSSVIGTILEARDRGAKAFFVYNNPSSVLCEYIERSRDVIEREDITTIDLSTGPMAVAGSTRMQATTIELLIVGSAFDAAILDFTKSLPQFNRMQEFCEFPPSDNSLDLFDQMLDDLSTEQAVDSMTEWVNLEVDLYKKGGRITYFADELLLDIFTDTTERSPTFMLPPFRKCDDFISPPPWAFVKHPLFVTTETWYHVLGRSPRCIEWNSNLYKKIGASDKIIAEPPNIGLNEINKMLIGREEDASRFEGVESIAMAVIHGYENCHEGFPRWSSAFHKMAKKFTRTKAVIIGGNGSSTDDLIQIPCEIESSPLDLWNHLASKLVLNTISTATMGCCGRLAGNWMAHVDTSNKKLIDRGTRLISELADVDYKTACYALHKTIADLKTNHPDDKERPSPVAETIRRLTQR